jgi:hypothetical protein
MTGALTGDAALFPDGVIAPGPVPAAVALEVHRGTVLGALEQALALAFPTVAALLGRDEFARACIDYVRADPPREASLFDYGGGFPASLEHRPPGAAPTWLADVARFDRAIERSAASPLLQRIIPLDRAASLSLPVSLEALRLDCRADLIRDAVESGAADRAKAAAGRAGSSWFAVWRSGDGAAVQPLSPPAGLFLHALLTGLDAGAALAAACGASDADEALLTIQREVFAARFTEVIPTIAKDIDP